MNDTISASGIWSHSILSIVRPASSKADNEPMVFRVCHRVFRLEIFRIQLIESSWKKNAMLADK